MDRFKKIKIQTIKKILQKKGYKVSKKNESLFNLYYTVFAGVFLILFFYSIPLVVNISTKFFKKNEIVVNTSNKNFNKVLEGKQIEIDSSDESDEVNYKGLFLDVLNFDVNVHSCGGSVQ